MGELQQYYDACVRGMFASEDARECGCRGHGWFLSEVDTWHKCPVHFDGQRHPEDHDEDEPLGDAPAEPLPAMIATDEVGDDDIPF